ncbi:MAG: hypothetical protein GX660_14045 [Clostridiaceae bacterium]|nr:hypothetical protein [Clostridiaceae bacterium]
MNNDLYQYSTAISGEIIEDVLIELSNIMEIQFDREKFDKALYNGGGLDDINNLCVFRDLRNKDRFIISDLSEDYNTILVRCSRKEHKTIRKLLIDKTNKSWEDDGLADRLTEADIPNTYNTEKDSYKKLLEFFKVDYI